MQHLLPHPLQPWWIRWVKSIQVTVLKILNCSLIWYFSFQNSTQTRLFYECWECCRSGSWWGQMLIAVWGIEADWSTSGHYRASMSHSHNKASGTQGGGVREWVSTTSAWQCPSVFIFTLFDHFISVKKPTHNNGCLSLITFFIYTYT